MGNLFSKKPVAPVAPAGPQKPLFTPNVDLLRNATLSVSDANIAVQQAAQQANEALKTNIEATKAATQAAADKVLLATRGRYKVIFWILGFLLAVALGIVLYDAFAPDSWPNIFFSKDSKGVTSTSTTEDDANKKKPVTDSKPPPLLKKYWYSIFGNSSANLAPLFHDATQQVSIKSSEAPLSADREGGYGMQWWMYVKDWNYGYGKKKAVVVRPDSSNGSIMNPEISLHPTDNSLQISVSVYPSKDGSTGKSTPAAAGHSGSTDDVFVCDVPNIPLQTWFSVGVTVFGRNLDVYIDGKLVKSCFLTGVPKPAVGDIQLTPGGGFSGRICDFYHYPRMLTPADALTFWSGGTKCRNIPDTGKGSGSGYSVKFGIHDTLGKEVQEYTF